MSRSHAILLSLLLPTTWVAQAHAQDGKLAQDVEFVRALAKDLRFVSLAQEEVENLKTTYKQSADFKLVSQLGVEISLIGAKVRQNREERRGLYEDAIKQCEDILTAFGTEPVADAARQTMVEAVYEYGLFLIEDIEIAKVEAPDKVKEIEDRAADVFRKGVNVCTEVMASLRPKKDANQKAYIDYHITWLVKGKLLREHARAVAADRPALCNQAEEVLTELVFEVGEETALGLRGMFELAMVGEVRGQLEQAAGSYRDVIESAMKSLLSDELNLQGDIRDIMIVMMEEAYAHLTSTLFDLGKADEVLTAVTAYRDHLKALTVPLTTVGGVARDGKPIAPVDGNEDERFGHLVYINEARALFETGKAENISRALELAKYFNDKHPSDFVGLRAKEVIRQILESQSQLVSVGLLMEIAKGDYQLKNYELAIQGYKKALGSMSAEERPVAGVEAWLQIGRSLFALGRELEATLAFAEGLGAAKGKNESTEQIADLIQRSMRNVRIQTAQDPAFEPLNRRVTELAANFGSAASEAKIFFDQGNAAMADRTPEGYLRAAEAFRKVPEDSIYTEQARGREVFALMYGSKFAEARKRIADYREWRKSNKANIASDRTDLLQVRAIAEAEIDYAEANMIYEEAIGSDRSGAKRDPTKFPEVQRLLNDYVDRHGKTAKNLAESSLFILGRSLVETGDVEKAEEKFRQLRQLNPQNSTLAGFASSIFDAYHKQCQALELAVKEAAKGGDRNKIRAAEEKLTAMQRNALRVGNDYVQNSDDASFGIMYHTLSYANALSDWKIVEELGDRMLKKFEGSKNADDRQNLDLLVKPLLGRALLDQFKYQQAYTLLSAAEKASPQSGELKRLVCLALGGYATVERGQIVERPGMGKYAEAYTKYWDEYRIWGLAKATAPDYSLPWYRYHFEAFWFARKAAEKGDSTFQERAQQLFGKARSIDDFAALRALGPEGQTLFDLFDRFRP